MEKSIAAVELGSKKIKIVVGYVLDGQVYVVYTLVKPYGLCIENGQILDPEKISETINSVREFTDPLAKVRINITDVILCLPPYSLEIFQTRQMTGVSLDDLKISTLDVKNIYSQIRNSANTLNENALVDVVPESFTLDQGRIFAHLPIGETSSTIAVSAKVHVLPKKMVEQFKNVLINGGVVPKRLVVSSLAAVELISSYKNMPQSYILVDIGSNVTTVSFVGNNALYGSTYFSWGSDHISERIIENFNINEADAEKYKIMYGIDEREMNFRAPVCTTDDGQGREIHHYNDELNHIIQNELNIFVKKLNDAIEYLVSLQHDKSYCSFPMLLIGGGSELNGLEQFLKGKVASETITALRPQNLGARSGTFFNCLGSILAHAKYINVNDESHTKAGNVTRNHVK